MIIAQQDDLRIVELALPSDCFGQDLCLLRRVKESEPITAVDVSVIMNS